MVSGKTNRIYSSVIEVSQDYLGPAAHRFIDRSIANHLHKEPADLNAKDLKKLIDWVRVSVAVLTEDNDMVAEYVSRLNDLSSNSKGSS